MSAAAAAAVPNEREIAEPLDLMYEFNKSLIEFVLTSSN
jgi:hypothetical protein